MTWTLRFTPAAERQIDALDPAIRRRILNALARLARAPRAAPNVKALTGTDHYRMRVGDWRVIYTLRDDVVMVLVISVAHRREVYR